MLTKMKKSKNCRKIKIRKTKTKKTSKKQFNKQKIARNVFAIMH